MPTIIESILSIIGTVFGGITDEQKLKIQLELQKNQDLTDLLKGQIETDTAEAANPNLFVSGWRPFIGWVCASAFCWVFIIEPIVDFSATLSGHPIVLPKFDTSTLMSLTMGMLGLSTLRTYEKTSK